MQNKFNTMVEFTAVLQLTESEARALAVLFSYQGGPDGFLKTFYQSMGRAYLEPHEHGIRSLAVTLGTQLGPHLHTVDAARDAIAKAIHKLCTHCGGVDGRHFEDCERPGKAKK